MATLEELVIRIKADTAELERGMRKAQGIVQQSGAGMSNSLKAVSDQAKALLPALSVAALVAFGKSAFQSADHINDLALRTGFAGSTLSSLNIKLRQSGSNLDDFSGSINRMNNLIGEAAKGTNQEAIKAFDALGLSVKKLQQLSPEEQFFEITEALAAVKSQAEFTNAGIAIFGRSFANIAPLILETKGRLREYTEEQKRLGLALTDEQLDRIDKLGDTWILAIEKMKLVILDSGIITYVTNLAHGIDAIYRGVKYIAEMAPMTVPGAGANTGANASYAEPIWDDVMPKKAKSAKGSNAGLLQTEASKATKALKEYNTELQHQHEFSSMAPRDAAAQKVYYETLALAQKAGVKDAEALAQANAGIARSNYDMQDAMQESARFSAELKDQFAQTAGSMITGATSARQAITNLANALAEMIAKKYILGPLADGLFGSPGSGMGGGLLGSLMGGQGDLSRLFSTGSTSFVGPLPSFDVGTDYVPRDMIAKIHKGEQIVPAGQNRGGNTTILNFQISNDVPALIQAHIKNSIAPIVEMATNNTFNKMKLGGAESRTAGLRK